MYEYCGIAFFYTVSFRRNKPLTDLTLVPSYHTIGGSLILLRMKHGEASMVAG